LSRGVAVSIGNALIPALNNMLAKLNDANRADLSIWQILGALPKQGEDVATQLKQASAELEKLKAQRAELQKQNLADGGSTDTSAIENAIAAEEKRVEYLKLQNKRIAGDDEDGGKRAPEHRRKSGPRTGEAGTTEGHRCRKGVCRHPEN
jgi:hypothetical protein